MNTRQQRYFLLGIILLSFFLSGQMGGEKCREDCFDYDSDKPRSIHSLADEYYDIHVRINGGCGGTVTPMEARVVEGTGVGTFTVTPGGCKSMSVDVGGGGSLPHPISPSSVVGTTITYQASGVDLTSIVYVSLTVDFYADCPGERAGTYPLSDECQEDTGNGGTPVITDGEPVDELPEEEVYPEDEEEEPEQGSGGGGCKPSGAACSPFPAPNSSCCSGYCTDGGCF